MAARTPPKISYIYLLQCGDSDIYKIGYSGDKPEAQRIHNIRYYLGKDIQIIDYALCESKFERLFHKRYASQRVEMPNRCQEFFRLTPEDVAFVLAFFKRMKSRKFPDRILIKLGYKSATPEQYLKFKPAIY